MRHRIIRHWLLRWLAVAVRLHVLTGQIWVRQIIATAHI